jgi:hypothetical protein
MLKNSKLPNREELMAKLDGQVDKIMANIGVEE